MADTQTNVINISKIPGLDKLWSETKGDSQICVAILDGPVNQSHPCFDGAKLTRVQSMISETASTRLMSSHGTHITSIIFGQPSSEVRGIASACRGLIVPVFSDARRGSLSQLDLARAINQAVEQGAHVINISGGQLVQATEADPMLAKAVKFCNDNGVLIVAAAGNDGCQCLHVPAALPSVLAVGAMNAQGLPFDFSNWGETYQTQGILAPGKNIQGAESGGGTALKSGTSFATPIISGIVALLLSVQMQRGEKPDPQAVRKALLKSALPCQPETIPEKHRCLAGRLNIPGAYALITQGGQTVVFEEKLATLPSEANPLNQNESGVFPLLSSETNDLIEQPAPHPSAVGVQAAAVATTSESSPPTTLTLTSENTMTDMPSNAVALSVTPSNIQPSGNCGCAGGQVAPSVQPSYPNQSLIYAIGTLGYDFGTEARRDTFKQLMPLVRSDNLEPILPETTSLPNGVFAIPPNPYDARQMRNYLENNLSESKSLIWTLNLELTPIYAIEPQGSFAFQVYELLREFLAGQILDASEAEYIERISIPGISTGRTVRLFSGQVVPIIEVTNTRGMYGWKVNNLIESVLAAVVSNENLRQNDERILKIRYSLENFLQRIYYDLRNLGQTSQERALNYSATNAFQYASGLINVLRDQRRPRTGTNTPQAETMQLDSIELEKSPFCRMDSDCWDIKLKFFDPENNERAKKVLRYTVDVSDIMPVTLGEPKIWDVAY
ncbi:S8 family peptidase [Nostoc sp. UIC 10607]|uniref:S8 family peptidase n=1 Tax=Nostoc sp. UIC 10607 TaxID=3045935 RepID=UPI00399F793F